MKYILLLLTIFLCGCQTLDKNNAGEIIIKDGGVNDSHIIEAETLIIKNNTAELK